MLGVLLGVLLTLFLPEGADYARPITASTPGFQNLKTALEHIWRTIVRLSLLYYDYLFNVQWINPIFHGIYDMNNQQWQHHKKKLFTVTYHESIESWCDATIVSRSKLGRYKLWCFRIGKKILKCWVLQVNLCQKLLFLHQLTHNMTANYSMIGKFNTWKFQAQTWGEHVVYRNCFWHSEQFLYTCSAKRRAYDKDLPVHIVKPKGQLL